VGVFRNGGLSPTGTTTDANLNISGGKLVSRPLPVLLFSHAMRTLLCSVLYIQLYNAVIVTTVDYCVDYFTL